LLQLDHITLYLGERILFKDISATINKGEKIGLTGPNGAGKSTLLRIISGDQKPDEGTVHLSTDSTVGYLPQDGVAPDPGLSLLQEVEHAFDEIKTLEKRLDDAHQKLQSFEHGSKEHSEALEQYGNLQHRLESMGVYSLQSEIEKVLKGLGFKDEDFERSTAEFSGGWLMRIALAKLLLTRPDYLMLDEPTNHLDIESLQWIEEFLINYEGAVIIVSHDKAFLNSVTERTLFLRNGSLYDYAGNYSYFENKYAEHQELLRKKYENQMQEIKETERFIERFRYKASKARQVQSRIRQLEKMEVEVPDEEPGEIAFRFPPPERSGLVVMELKNVKKSYDEHKVFDGLDYQVERGEKIAVVGPNGAGKSTLIRILAGTETVNDGDRIEGHNVTTSWFAQHQADELNPDNNALEEMLRAAGHGDETRLRTVLGCFLFTGDDVFKNTRVLSGGEKSRLALAKMLVKPANFLIFDEPTNHLDMQSKNILQQALIQFEGTLVIVSHDRDFLDPIVNKTVEVQPGAVKTYPGNVSWYLSKKEQQENGSNKSQKNIKANSVSNDSTPSKKEQKRIEAEKRNLRYQKVRPLQNSMKKIEKEIGALENRKAEMETLMAQPSFYDDDEQVKEASIEYERLKKSLNEFYSKWEEIAGRIEFIENEIG